MLCTSEAANAAVPVLGLLAACAVPTDLDCATNAEQGIDDAKLVAANDSVANGDEAGTIVQVVGQRLYTIGDVEGTCRLEMSKGKMKMKNIAQSIVTLGALGLLAACAAPTDLDSEANAEQGESSEPEVDGDHTDTVQQAAVNYSHRFVKKKSLIIYSSNVGDYSQNSGFCFNASTCAYACVGYGKPMKSHACAISGPQQVTRLNNGSYVLTKEHTTTCFCAL